MSVRVLIAEDEEPLREEMVRLLEEAWPECELVAVCADGDEAMQRFDVLRPDVCFLDVKMPGASGLDVAAHVGERAHVVFVTAYDEFAIEAFERGAIGYLLKPVERAKFAAVVDRVRERCQSSPPSLLAVIDELRQKLSPEATTRPGAEPLQWITATVGDTVKFFPIEDVLAFVSRDKYTQVLTAEDDAVIRTSLKELSKRLDDEVFWQVHRSALVRVSAIDRIERASDGRHQLVLKQRDDRLPVSASFRSRIRAM